MPNKLMRGLALLLVLMMAAALAGCAGNRRPDDLPVATSEPTPMEDLFTVPPEETDAPSDASELPTETPTAVPTEAPTEAPTPAPTECPVKEDGKYDSKDEVALYIHLFGHLPSNYITKRDAQELGWTGGGLDRYAPGCSIGGDRFGNYEGTLPAKPGRKYTECDIGTAGKSSRGAKRIVFSNDGLIYYTDDHYESFTLLYGEE